MKNSNWFWYLVTYVINVSTKIEFMIYANSQNICTLDSVDNRAINPQRKAVSPRLWFNANTIECVSVRLCESLLDFRYFDRDCRSSFKSVVIWLVFFARKEDVRVICVHYWSRFFKEFGRSFTYIRNSKGPRMLPCGTPHVTGITGDEQFSILTVCVRLLR